MAFNIGSSTIYTFLCCSYPSYLIIIEALKRVMGSPKDDVGGV